MDRETKKRLLEQQIRVYGDISGSIETLQEFLKIIHGQSTINNLPAVRLGMKMARKQIDGILKDLDYLDEAKEEVGKIYDEEDAEELNKSS